ncbi:MAG: CvpA family protein, partial [Candidatus Omnitrophica bacterium]|nr:CvpA family protein [Candidatus Omnitrophota bacterium]
MTEFFQKINWTDLLVVILLIRSSYVGFTRGFSWEFFRLIGVVCAAIGAIYFYEDISLLIGDYLPIIYPISSLLSFTAIYTIILFLLRLINLFMEKIIKIEVFSILEKIGGLCLGFLRGGILLSLLMISLILTPIPYFERSIKQRAYS